MCAVFSHTTALKYFRTPPEVHALYEHYPDLDYEQGKRWVARSANAGESPFGSMAPPFHLLISEKRVGYPSDSFIYHVWANEVLPGMIWDTEHGFSVTSPMFTLMSLGRWLSTHQLTMLLYEFMGTFTVYRPTEGVREALQSKIDSNTLSAIDGWVPALDADDNLTDLWKRPPLIQWNDFNRFVSSVEGVPGVGKLKAAARDVYGMASSPFEVRAAMLLGMPRRRGGQGFAPLELNYPIPLSAQARRICTERTCFADLYFEGDERRPPLIVECQGNAYHGGERAAEDDNRAMALQSMGHTVLRLRSQQLKDEYRLDDTAKCIAGLLHADLKPKSKGLKRAERSLLADLSIDWWNLGEIQRVSRPRNKFGARN